VIRTAAWVLLVVAIWWVLFDDGSTVIGNLFRDAKPEISSCVNGDGAPSIKCPEWHLPGGGR
jgi:hypothetical protein